MRRLIALSALLIAVVSGCGDDGSTSDASGSDSSGSSSSGDAKTAPEDVCGTLSAADVGTAMGATVTGEEVPGGGCSYEQDDPRELSVSVSTVPTTSDNGGFEAALTGARAVLTDVEEKQVPGVGNAAVILSGTFSGLGSQATTGLADVGEYAVLVQLLGGDKTTHAAIAEDVLKLAVDTLG